MVTIRISSFVGALKAPFSLRLGACKLTSAANQKVRIHAVHAGLDLSIRLKSSGLV